MPSGAPAARPGPPRSDPRQGRRGSRAAIAPASHRAPASRAGGRAHRHTSAGPQAERCRSPVVTAEQFAQRLVHRVRFGGHRAPLDIAEDIIEIGRARRDIGVTPGRVAQGRATLVLQCRKEIRSIPQAAGAQLQADECSEGLFGGAAARAPAPAIRRSCLRVVCEWRHRCPARQFDPIRHTTLRRRGPARQASEAWARCAHVP